MHYRYPLRVLLSILALCAGIYGGYVAFRPSGFPFIVKVTSPRIALIKPLARIPLPPALHPDDRIDLAALNTASRIAVTIANDSIGQTLPLGHTYALVIQRPNGLLTIPVTTVDLSHDAGAGMASFSTASMMGLMTVIAVLLLWLGRDRAAGGMTLWSIAWMMGVELNVAPFADVAGIAVMLFAFCCVVASRVGFYIMFEAMLWSVFKPRMILLWRSAFAVLCAVNLFWVLATVLWFPLTGSASWLVPGWGSLFGAPYLVPLLMLIVGYHAANVALRQRLRWMLWSGVIWVMVAFVNDVVTFVSVSWNLLWMGALIVAVCGFLYAVLRHRLVAVSLVVDRTLVYGSVTALVVGILAAVNSLVEYVARGTSAGLMVQIVVALALGIVLGQMRNYADKFVERVFFRRRYLADKALRRFARHCGGYESTQELLSETAKVIYQKMNAPGVVLYLRQQQQYIATQRMGRVAYPDTIKVDDPALAAARTRSKDIELSELHSMLGTDGYVFPMGPHAVLACANRPGEHYASDERRLLAFLTAKVGEALQALDIKEKIALLENRASLVEALANGALPAPPEVQARARALLAAT